MAFEVNKFIVAGNLGKAAEVNTEGTSPRTTFSLANSRTYTSNGEKKTQTSWFPCVWYGDSGAKLAKYLEKGKSVLVEGRIEIRQYEKDGQKRSFTEVVVQSLQFVPDGGRKEAAAANDEDDDVTLDDVPF